MSDQNGIVALAILRLQLDTVLRLYALYWVADPEKFAERVFNGEQIDRLKAADGELMKDRYLINRIMSHNPWVDEVYKNTSGLIHFSGRHMHAALRLKDAETGAAEIFIGPTNPSHEMKEFQEMLEAFFHVTAMIVVRQTTGSADSIQFPQTTGMKRLDNHTNWRASALSAVHSAMAYS